MIKILFLAIALFFSSCSSKPKEKFVILSGSENSSLERIIKDFGTQNGVEIEMQYDGSLEIMRKLENGASGIDALWSASSIWLNLGDKQHIIKHSKSIMSSPVIFGIKESKAKELGFARRDVFVKDILDAIKSKKLTFMMTSATQSNSGAMAYLGFLNDLSNSEVLSAEKLDDLKLQKEIRELMSGINRSSGSSGWLKDLFLSGNYDAMVNYESIIIETNKELKNRGKEQLYAIYPKDGIAIADSPLAFVNKNDKNKEEFFLKLQEHLLSQKIQKEILKEGRRVFGEVADFDKELGFKSENILNVIKIPNSTTILKALNLYQYGARKPSFTVFCLDYSGSMAGNRIFELKNAMKTLLDQKNAKDYFLQFGKDDKIGVIIFNHEIKAEISNLNSDSIDESLSEIAKFVDSRDVGGGTDIYTPSMRSIEMLKGLEDKYVTAVILLTDGESNSGMSLVEFENLYKKSGVDIPVFSIYFGDAKKEQLESIASTTRARVFDGKKDLAKAFRSARGYN